MVMTWVLVTNYSTANPCITTFTYAVHIQLRPRISRPRLGYFAYYYIRLDERPEIGDFAPMFYPSPPAGIDFPVGISSLWKRFKSSDILHSCTVCLSNVHQILRLVHFPLASLCGGTRNFDQLPLPSNGCLS